MTKKKRETINTKKNVYPGTTKEEGFYIDFKNFKKKLL
jgi:hypothetical protein